MDTDTLIIEFAKKWLPWNYGPDEDIWVEFGLSPDRYYARLATLLSRPRSGLREDDRHRLIDLCQRKIALTW